MAQWGPGALIYLLCCQLLAGADSHISHKPIVRYSSGSQLTFEADAAPAVEEVKLFILPRGEKQFLVFDLERVSRERFQFKLEPDSLPPRGFDYYLLAREGEDLFYSPAGAPETPISCFPAEEVSAPLDRAEKPEEGEASPPQEAFRLPLRLQATAGLRLASREPDPDVPASVVDADLSFFPTFGREGSLQFKLNGTLRYGSHPSSGESALDLPDLLVQMAVKNHVLRSGDLDIQESELTVSGLGRRGVDYLYDGQRVYLHVFDVSTQQLLGFKGFGIPNIKAGLWGGAGGYRFLTGDNSVFLKTVFITGQDDPRLGGNISLPSPVTSRRGSVVAVCQETSLFSDKFRLTAELARSRYDGDVDDTTEAASDNAWNVGSEINLNVFSLAARYKYIGRDFNSIGLPFITNDRMGWETQAGLVTKVISLNGLLTAFQDNVRNEAGRETAKDMSGAVMLSLAPSEKLTLACGYKTDRQKSFQQDLQTSTRNSRIQEISGSLNFTPNASSAWTASIITSRTSDYSLPQNGSSSLAVALSGALSRGDSFHLNPGISYTATTIAGTGEKTHSLNPFLNGEIFFIPKVMSVSFLGAYLQEEAADPAASSSGLSSGASLNVYVNRLLQICSLSFSLKGDYDRRRTGGTTVTRYNLAVSGSISF